MMPGDAHQTALFLRWLAGQLDDGMMEIRTASYDGNEFKLSVYDTTPAGVAERLHGTLTSRRDLAYCRRCDLAFCREHLDEHMGHPGFPDQVPTEADAIAYKATFCAVCGGVLKPRSQR